MIGLDPHAIKELKGLMGEMRNAGATILVSTHIIDSVDMLWDRTLIMQSCVVRADVTKSSLDASGKSLEQLFFDVTEGIGRDAMSHTEDPASQGG
jgi:ABC-type multidrug transport system ATPase subunit